MNKHTSTPERSGGDADRALWKVTEIKKLTQLSKYFKECRKCVGVFRGVSQVHAYIYSIHHVTPQLRPRFCCLPPPPPPPKRTVVTPQRRCVVLRGESFTRGLAVNGCNEGGNKMCLIIPQTRRRGPSRVELNRNRELLIFINVKTFKSFSFPPPDQKDIHSDFLRALFMGKGLLVNSILKRVLM